MVGIGEYIELVENPKVNKFRLNTNYDSIIRYYEDLLSGIILPTVPYDIILSKYIISCRFINEYNQESILIASIKNRIYAVSVR